MAAQYKQRKHMWHGNIDDQSFSIKTNRLTGSRHPLPSQLHSVGRGRRSRHQNTDRIGGERGRVSSAGYNGSSCHVAFGVRPTTTVMSVQKPLKSNNIKKKKKTEERKTTRDKPKPIHPSPSPPTKNPEQQQQQHTNPRTNKQTNKQKRHQQRPQKNKQITRRRKINKEKQTNKKQVKSDSQFKNTRLVIQQLAAT